MSWLFQRRSDQQASVNPLLISLPPEMTKVELAAWLEHRPAKYSPTPSQVKGWIEQALVTTPIALALSQSLLKMMRQAAHAQDPRWLRNRIAAFSNEPLAQPQPLSAAGLCVQGVTGVGKSHIVRHVLSRIPQVVEHGACEEAEMLSLVQLVHLTIQLSGDGTPIAFFLNALTDIDSALGTDYASEARKMLSTHRRNTLMSFFMSKLKLHRALVLVIEEGQEKNLGHAGFRKILDALVLQLLNFGIPIVVIGNPGGIRELFKESQALRRLTINGSYRIDPATHWTDPLWREEYVPGIWGLSPLEEPDEVWCTPVILGRFLWQATGGIPASIAKLRELSICNAMEHGSHRVRRTDVMEALASAEYVGSRELAEPFVKKDSTMLQLRFSDFDAGYFAELWLREAEEVAACADSASEPATPTQGAADESVPGAAVTPKSPGPQGDPRSKSVPRNVPRKRAARAPKPPGSPRAAPDGHGKRTPAEAAVPEQPNVGGLRPKKRTTFARSLPPEDVRSSSWVDNQPSDLDL